MVTVATAQLSGNKQKATRAASNTIVGGTKSKEKKSSSGI